MQRDLLEERWMKSSSNQDTQGRDDLSLRSSMETPWERPPSGTRRLSRDDARRFN